MNVLLRLVKALFNVQADWKALQGTGGLRPDTGQGQMSDAP